MKKRKKIGPEIHSLDRMLWRRMRAGMKAEGFDEVTIMNGWIIRYLYENQGKDVYQRDIEKRFSIGRSTVTNTIQIMEKKGYVYRESVASDARLKKVVLSSRGAQIQRAIDALTEKEEREVTRGISAEELNAFFAVMQKIEENLEEWKCQDREEE